MEPTKTGWLGELRNVGGEAFRKNGGALMSRSILNVAVGVIGLFLAFPLWMGCKGDLRDLDSFDPNPSDSAVGSPWQSEEDAQKFAGCYLFQRRLGATSTNPRAPLFARAICMEDLPAIHAIRFLDYRPMDWGDAPPYLDVETETGSRLRFVFEPPFNLVYPMMGDSTDISLDCKHCPDSLAIARRESQCRGPK